MAPLSSFASKNWLLQFSNYFFFRFCLLTCEGPKRTSIPSLPSFPLSLVFAFAHSLPSRPQGACCFDLITRKSLFPSHFFNQFCLPQYVVSLFLLCFLAGCVAIWPATDCSFSSLQVGRLLMLGLPVVGVVVCVMLSFAAPNLFLATYYFYSLTI
jgi:hypothetical protein